MKNYEYDCLSFCRVFQPEVPEEHIFKLFEDTDPDGGLYVAVARDWDDPYPDKVYKCKMTWNPEDCKAFAKDFRRLYRTFENMAGECEDEGISGLAAEPSDPAYHDVWQKYIRPFEGISDLMALAGKETKSEERIKLYQRIEELARKDAEKRFPSSIMAFEIVCAARNLYQLISSDQDTYCDLYLYDFEARKLAQAMALNTYCTEISEETVEDMDPDLPPDDEENSDVLRYMGQELTL